MENQQSKINALFEEYLNVVKEATHAFNDGKNCDAYKPWLQTYVDSILLEIKKAS